MENLEYYLSVAKDAARQAGDLLAKGYGASYELLQREADHYSINKDSESNLLYEVFLREKTPDISLYTEEGERSLASDLVWIVDPLDGTYNYRVALPLFVTQICLLYKKEPVVSVIYNPIFKQEFTAIKGGGAFLNGSKIFVNETSEMKRAMLSLSRRTISLDDGRMVARFSKAVRAVRLFGATGIDLSYIASGKAEITINDGSKIFDYAPGALLVREAGGIVTNLKGEPWTIDDDNLVASNKLLMPKVLEIINKA